jgi:hypothetical protein
MSTLQHTLLETLGNMAEAGKDTTVPSKINTVMSKLAVQEQMLYEKSYPIVVEPAHTTEQLDDAEIIDRMEIDHAVKYAPDFIDQLKDTRENEITYYGLEGFLAEKLRITESGALHELNAFLETAANTKAILYGDLTSKIESLRNSLTFIGEKEYQEAAMGIALYWKALLERNPNQQILALAGVGKTFGEERDSKAKFKSDDYLLDTILSYFTDEEVKKYKGRLITESSEITATDAKDLRVVLLDDWTISGESLEEAAGDFNEHFPQFISSVEIQLVAASDERIKFGLEERTGGNGKFRDLSVPVRAYFRAHKAPDATFSDAHITGAHSTVDFDFDSIIDNINDEARSQSLFLSDVESQILEYKPALARIARSYHDSNIRLTQRHRFRSRSL